MMFKKRNEKTEKNENEERMTRKVKTNEDLYLHIKIRYLNKLNECVYKQK